MSVVSSVRSVRAAPRFVILTYDEPATPIDVDELIAGAQERARQAVAQGIADLEEAVANAEEWSNGNRWDGAHTVIPKRALLAGMLEHLRSASA